MSCGATRARSVLCTSFVRRARHLAEVRARVAAAGRPWPPTTRAFTVLRDPWDMSVRFVVTKPATQ